VNNKKSIIVLFFQLLQTLISVFSLVLISRGLPIDIFGNYVYIITICSLLALFSGFGSEHVFLMNASKNMSQIEVLFGNAIFVRTIVNFGFFIFGIIFNFLTKFKFLEYSIFLIGYSIAAYINPLFIAFYRVNSSHIKPWILSFIGPLFFLLYLLCFCQFKQLIDIGYIFLLSNFVMFIFFCIDINRKITFRIDNLHLKRNGKVGFVFMFSQVFDYIFLRVDILVVKFILGPYLLGIYAVGQRLVSFLQIIPSSFHIVELPLFHSLATNLPELQIRFLKLRSTLIQIGVFLFGLLVLNSKWLIVLFFSSKYKEAEMIVWILSFAGLINFACYPYYMLAEALNKINERLYIRLITLACTILLLIVLCSFFKNEGAAIGILLGSFLFISLLHHLTIIGNGTIKMAFRDIKTIVISIFVLLAFISINRFFNDSNYILFITNGSFAGTMIYFLFKFGNLKEKFGGFNIRERK
jgi:O-antigen/teichoic acid export membrane protein